MLASATTVLDLGTVTLTRTRQRTPAEIAEEAARLRQNEIDNAAFVRSVVLNRRQGQTVGVTEEMGSGWREMNVEAFGPTVEAVEAEIARYRNQGTDPKRFDIRFFAITPDPVGGFVAHGRSRTEAF